MKEELLKAKAILDREPLLRVQGLESLRRGSAEIIAMMEDGLLLFDSIGRVPMLFADSAETARALLDALPETDVLVSDCAEMDEEIMEKRGLNGRTACHNVVYLKAEAPEVVTSLILRPLPMDKAELFSRHYRIHDLDEIRGIIAEGRLLGGYMEDVLVGFIGWHEEGSMGMLHVLEPCRCKGYGHAMEALLLRETLRRGMIPYGQVVLGNDASMDLQLKLGFTPSEKNVSWLYRED